MMRQMFLILIIHHCQVTHIEMKISITILLIITLYPTYQHIRLRDTSKEHDIISSKELMISQTAGFPVSESFPSQQRGCMIENSDSYINYEFCMMFQQIYNMFDFTRGVSIWMFFGLLIPVVNVIILASLVYQFLK